MKTNSKKNIVELPEYLRWRIEGPFDSSYSLALVNRNLAFGVEKCGHDVSLYSTEGPGDFDPNPEFLRTHPHERHLWEKNIGKKNDTFDVVSRYLYPPRVTEMNGTLNILHCYGWEETVFPKDWCKQFNKHLDAVFTASPFVKKTLIDSGVTIPVFVSGHGVDHWRAVQAAPFHIEAKKFRFLHISSCFPRKGVDVMLKAYGQAFTDQDDVSLIIKTFPNPHNEVHEWLRQAKGERTDFPHVIIIEEDFSPETLKGLMETCDALVAPSRGEGFGLPNAEAMLSGLSVITTNWSGQTMFCTPETAWLVDYSLSPAKTHFNLPDSFWAEPDEQDLSRTMKEVYAAPEQERQKRNTAALTLLKYYTWENVAKLIDSQLRSYISTPPCHQPRVGWVSTWNTRCGIAAYSEHLLKYFPAEVSILAPKTLDHFKDDESVIRCWEMNEQDPLNELEQTIAEQKIETLVIQFNFGFWDLKLFSDFLIRMKKRGLILTVCLHATETSPLTPHKKLKYILPGLLLTDRILVHSLNDVNRLKKLGLSHNVTLLPHGIVPVTNSEPLEVNPWLVATYGFFLPHKGLEQAIRAIALLREKGLPVRLRMVNAEYPAAISTECIQSALQLITTLKLNDFVELHTEFLPDKQSMALLQEASLVLFPYQATSESSSAAVRSGLSSGRPVVVTPIPIFDDVSPAVHKLDGIVPEAIAQGLESFLQSVASGDPAFLKAEEDASNWRNTHGFDCIAERLYGILSACFRDAQLCKMVIPSATAQ